MTHLQEKHYFIKKICNFVCCDIYGISNTGSTTFSHNTYKYLIMKYYLSRDYKSKLINSAGSKARMDIEKILSQNEYIAIGKSTVSKNKIRHFILTLAIVARIPFTLTKGDILVLQYPTKYYSFICRIAHLLKARVVTFIHDLSCFRTKHNSARKEIHIMNKSDALIGCNPTICKWLTDNGFVGHNKRKIVEPLNIFDFISASESTDKRNTWPQHKIVYAGQLARKKNTFLYTYGKYIKNYTVNIYGKGLDISNMAHLERFNLKGFVLPEDLIRSVEGDFGLVWDGDSIECCSGNWGEYLAINTPHKISLYIRCGLPILIWSKAAMADFIKKNKIGICIDTLHDINKIYDTLTKEDYTDMCENVRNISRQMSEGKYFNDAILRVISRLYIK